MSLTTTTVSNTSVHPRVQALKNKHKALSEIVDEAQKDLSTTDFYLNQLKKQKLVIKERLAEEERAVG